MEFVIPLKRIDAAGSERFAPISKIWNSPFHTEKDAVVLKRFTQFQKILKDAAFRFRSYSRNEDHQMNKVDNDRRRTDCSYDRQ